MRRKSAMALQFGLLAAALYWLADEHVQLRVQRTKPKEVLDVEANPKA